MDIETTPTQTFSPASHQSKGLPYLEVFGPFDPQLETPEHNQYDLRAELQRRATRQTADFIIEDMADAVSFDNRYKLLHHMLRLLNERRRTHGKQGLVAEFGVWHGESINFIAERTRDIVYGFDSFHGLETPWSGHQDFSRLFDRKGAAPKVADNVHLEIGSFCSAIPRFLKTNIEPFEFIHIDCDVYEAARDILTLCKDRIQKGTLIVFDDFFNYPGWKRHEFRAFQELITAKKCRVKYHGFSEAQVGLEIL